MIAITQVYEFTNPQIMKSYNNKRKFHQMAATDLSSSFGGTKDFYLKKLLDVNKKKFKDLDNKLVVDQMKKDLLEKAKLRKALKNKLKTSNDTKTPPKPPTKPNKIKDMFDKFKSRLPNIEPILTPAFNRG